MTSQKPHISVVIVNYNVKEYLATCLHSIEKAGQGLDLEIFVVDNASSDGSKTYIPHNFPGIKYIFNEENVGFGKANNQAIEQAKGEYTLIINPDTLISEDTLQTMIKVMDEHPECGASGCKILNSDGSFAPESRRSVPDIKAAASKVLGLNAIFPKNKVFGSYYMSWLDEDEASEIPVLSGAFMFFRTSVLQELGGFDERFFMYAEDIDLCYRTTQLGHTIRYVPETSIIHYKGESTRKGDLKYIRLFNKALYQFFEKHYTSRYSLLFRSLIFLSIVIRGLSSFVITKLHKSKYLLLDLAYLNIGLLLAFVLRFSFTDVLLEKLESLESLAFLWVNVLLTGLYIIFAIGFDLSRKYYLSISDSLRNVFLSYVGVTVITFFARNLAFSRLVLALGLVISGLLMVSTRLIRINRSRQPNTERGRIRTTRIIIVGEGESAQNMIQKINLRPDWQYEVLGIVSNELIEGKGYLGSLSQLTDLVKSRRVDHVYFMMDSVSHKDMFNRISELQDYDIVFKIVPESMDYLIGKSNVEYVESIPLVEVNLPYQTISNQSLKRAMDLSISIPGSIILFMLSIPFRLSSKEKADYDGLKLRLPLRKNRLVNLSNLMFNVLSGKLSLVGSSIESPYETIYSFKRGITGPVQLNRNRISNAEIQERFELNYLQNYTIWLDIDLILKTMISNQSVMDWSEAESS